MIDEFGWLKVQGHAFGQEYSQVRPLDESGKIQELEKIEVKKDLYVLRPRLIENVQHR
jgi:hypothetical protein